MKSKIVISLLTATLILPGTAVLAEGMKKDIIEKPQPTFPREEEKDVLDFRKLDKNNNGSITSDEFNADQQFDPGIFEEIDANKDGRISDPELSTWSRTNKGKTIEDLRPTDRNSPPPQDEQSRVPDSNQVIDSNPNPEQPSGNTPQGALPP